MRQSDDFGPLTSDTREDPRLYGKQPLTFVGTHKARGETKVDGTSADAFSGLSRIAFAYPSARGVPVRKRARRRRMEMEIAAICCVTVFGGALCAPAD